MAAAVGQAFQGLGSPQQHQFAMHQLAAAAQQRQQLVGQQPFMAPQAGFDYAEPPQVSAQYQPSQHQRQDYPMETVSHEEAHQPRPSDSDMARSNDSSSHGPQRSRGSGSRGRQTSSRPHPY
jgi:hypothetical protein